MTNLTYSTKAMDDVADHRGIPWVIGTLRVFHDDDRQRWSVTKPGCGYYYTAVAHWAHGEFFDGTKWVPMAEWSGSRAGFVSKFHVSR